MTNKEIFRKISEYKKLKEAFREISIKYPLSVNYAETVLKLDQYIADLTEKLYKKQD